MPAFIRYPFFGCVILALSACGSSGSSRLLEPATPAMDDDDPVSTVQETYSDVRYLVKEIPAAIVKFAANLKQVYRDADGNKYLLTSDNVADMDLMGVDLPTGVDTAPDFADLLAVYEDEDGNEYLLTPANVADMDLDDVALPDGVTTRPDFADLMKVREGDGTGATRLSGDPASLDALKDSIVASSNRYLSTGAVFVEKQADGTFMSDHYSAACSDAGATDRARCMFEEDPKREKTTSRIGGDFSADRQSVMQYRNVLLSQVRTSESDARRVYQDDQGNEYLLTAENVENGELPATLPDGVTQETAPEFNELLAVYKDDQDNEYLLTKENVDNEELPATLPDGVAQDTAPAFSDLNPATKEGGDGYHYVGYDGMLRYSMFYIGVHKFFDDEGDLEHMRFSNASFGRIYDEDPDMDGAQNPSVKLTGEGVMVGVESRKGSLEEHYLVQGDVNIMYDPAVAADDTVTPNIEAMNAMVDISIDNIQRLANDEEAWYGDEGSLYSTALKWTKEVTDSEFSYDQNGTVTATPGTLRGSFYGTEDNPEVGGVFHHESPLYEIIGSFGSKLSEPKMDDPDDMDMMDP